MIELVAASLLAATAALPEARGFWTASSGPTPQPVQQEVRAHLVGTGRFVAIYQEDGYHFSTSGDSDESRQVAAAISAFDQSIYPREVELLGPCPDRDANGKVLVLLTPRTLAPAMFFPFDLAAEEDAVKAGFHSNQGEVLYHTFEQQGNRSGRNIQGLAVSFHRLLLFSRVPGKTSWSAITAGYAPYLCGLAPVRLLWGDFDPDGTPHPAAEPWTDAGWSLLFLEYLRETLGEQALRQFVASPESGIAGLASVLPAGEGHRRPADLLADYAMACWLDDPSIGAGRFAFPTVAPPRPPFAARAVASRPTSGAIDIGVGGMAYLLIEGSGEPPFPLTMQGDPSGVWIGRAVLLRDRGPDQEMPLRFGADGVARLDIPPLAKGDRVVVSTALVPGPSPMFDRRTLTLRWGLAWVTRVPVDQGRTTLAGLVSKLALPDGGEKARQRLGETLDRLSGGNEREGGGSSVPTRYAWAPGAAAVVATLAEEAAHRGLPTRVQTFSRRAPSGITQDWQNLIIELPGGDPRRWPVVVASHWDAARGDLADSYLHALDVDDNASGVAVALEVAAALHHLPHRAPVIVAFLAGGCHGAAGAEALMDELGNRIAAWIELEGVGIPDSWPRTLNVHILESPANRPSPSGLGTAIRRVGLIPRAGVWEPGGHTGAPLADDRGVPACVIQSFLSRGQGDADLPVAVERDRVAPNLLVLLTRAVSVAVANLAGTP